MSTCFVVIVLIVGMIDVTVNARRHRLPKATRENPFLFNESLIVTRELAVLLRLRNLDQREFFRSSIHLHKLSSSRWTFMFSVCVVVSSTFVHSVTWEQLSTRRQRYWRACLVVCVGRQCGATARTHRRRRNRRQRARCAHQCGTDALLRTARRSASALALCERPGLVATRRNKCDVLSSDLFECNPVFDCVDVRCVWSMRDSLLKSVPIDDRGLVFTFCIAGERSDLFRPALTPQRASAFDYCISPRFQTIFLAKFIRSSSLKPSTGLVAALFLVRQYVWLSDVIKPIC